MKKLLIICLTGILALPAYSQNAHRNVDNRSLTEKLNDRYCTGIFKSTDGTIIDLSAENAAAGYNNIFNFLNGRVAGYDTYLNRIGTLVPLIRGNVPAIYIDEIPATPAAVNFLSVNDIAMVKIIKTAFYAGFNGGNGAIAIYTFDEEDE